MAKNRRAEEVRAIAAARLACRGFLQKDIAEKLSISQPEVSRALLLARNRRWIRTTPRLRKEAIPEDLWQEADQKYFSHTELLDHLRSMQRRRVLRHVTVIHAKPPHFGEACAARIAELLAETKVMGVMWGDTIAQVVEALEDRPGPPLRKRRPVSFIPLCGEPTFLMKDVNIDASASRLAAHLSRCVNGPGDHPPSLVGVPAYIPLEFKGVCEDSIRQFIARVPGYSRVFGGPSMRGQPLVEQMDSLLTGVGAQSRGSDDKFTGIFLKARIEQGDTTQKELTELVFGDLGGVLIERPGLTKARQARVDELNRGWTGMRYADFERCARAAESGNRVAGVTVIAAGKRKADMVREIVRRGLVNHLLLDESLALALKKDVSAS